MKKRFVGVLCAGILWACVQPASVPLHAPEPPQVFTADCDGLRMQFILQRRLRSAPTYEIYVTDQAGQPLPDSARVIVAFTSVGKNISTTTVVAQPQGAGRYGPAGGFTLSPGAWQVEAIVRQVNGTETVCVFALGV
jgi:hypothetical protein